MIISEGTAQEEECYQALATGLNRDKCEAKDAMMEAYATVQELEQTESGKPLIEKFHDEVAGFH